MDPSATVSFFGLGAAVIGFWAVVRFPSIGPQRVGSAFLFALATMVVQSPLLALTGPVVAAFGVPAALLFVILPSLTLLFWATGCLIRSLVALATPFRR